jgi:hypothetical protein
VAASVRAGMSTGAWLAQTAVTQGRMALRPTLVEPGDWMREFMTTTAELMEQRRLLRNVGGLLNQVAATGNSTGELPAEVDQVIALVARVVERVEQVAGKVRELTRERRALLA